MKKENKAPSIWQWKTIEYIAYLLIFLVPLYFNTNHFAPFSTTKIFLIFTGVFLMLILWAWGYISHAGSNSSEFRITWLHIVLAFYFLMLTLSGFLGVDPHNSFFGTFIEPVSIIFLYAVGVFAILMSFLAESNKNFFPNIITVSFISSVIVAGIAYMGTSLIDLSQRGSTLGNTSYAGAYLLFNVCFGLALFLKTTKLWKRIIITLGLLVILISPIFFNINILKGNIPFLQALHNPLQLLGEAMGATLGLAVALISSLSLWMFISKHKTLKISGAILFVMLAGTIFFTGYQLITPGSNINKLYVEEETGSRFIFWDIANSGFVERPIFGWGFGNYDLIYQKYFNSEIMSPKYSQESWVAQPHNIIWENLSTGGITGTIAYFMFLGYLLYILFRSSLGKEGRPEFLPIFFFGALIGNFVQNLFLFDITETYLMCFLIVGAGFYYSSPIHIFYLKKDLLSKIISGIMIIFSITGLVFLVVNPWRESIAMKKAITTKSISNIPQALKGVQEISFMGNIRDTALLSDKLIVLFQKFKNQVKPEEKAYFLSTIDAVVTNLETELKTEPNNFRAEFVAGKLLNMYSLIDGKAELNLRKRANTHFKNALAINPHYSQIYNVLAQSRLIENNLRGAATYLRESIAINPDNKTSYGLAQILIPVLKDRNFEKYVQIMEARWTPE